MADEITNFSQDGNDNSFSFAFTFDDGSGNKVSKNIDVFAHEAGDLVSAKQISLQKAADAKQDWLDGIKNAQIVGTIILPAPKPKSARVADIAAVSDLSGG